MTQLAYDTFAHDTAGAELHNPSSGYVSNKGFGGWYVDDNTKLLLLDGPPTTKASCTASSILAANRGITSMLDIVGMDRGILCRLSVEPNTTGSDNSGLAFRVGHDNASPFNTNGDGFILEALGGTYPIDGRMSWVLYQKIAGVDVDTLDFDLTGVLVPGTFPAGWDWVVLVTENHLCTAWLEPLGGGAPSANLFTELDLSAASGGALADSDHLKAGMRRSGPSNPGQSFLTFEINSLIQPVMTEPATDTYVQELSETPTYTTETS